MNLELVDQNIIIVKGEAGEASFGVSLSGLLEQRLEL